MNDGLILEIIGTILLFIFSVYIVIKMLECLWNWNKHDAYMIAKIYRPKHNSCISVTIYKEKIFSLIKAKLNIKDCLRYEKTDCEYIIFKIDYKTYNEFFGLHGNIDLDYIMKNTVYKQAGTGIRTIIL